MGDIFDTMLSFALHIKYVFKSRFKALDILNVIGNTKLDYGCIVYGSARRSYFHMQYPDIRICLGVFRTSPVEIVYIDALEPCFHDQVTV